MPTLTDKAYLLAGDIGGTKTNLGLFKVDSGVSTPDVLEAFSSQEEPDLAHMLRRFTARHPARIASACFGVAGPVERGRAKTTNLPWDVSEEGIREVFDFPHVRLVNDVAATAVAVPLLPDKELLFLNRGVPAGGNLAVIAPGTGLGLALMTCQAGACVPLPSEGGHADFAPNNEFEVELWRFLHRKFGHVSIERVLSGVGLVNIHDWLTSSQNRPAPEWLVKQLRERDPAQVISAAALEKRDPGCVEALDRFVSIFGAVAGNLALTALATGGVYLGGGIPPKIIPKLTDGTFMRAFTHKGRFKPLLQEVPVRVILDDRAALIGAAYIARGMVSPAGSVE